MFVSKKIDLKKYTPVAWPVSGLVDTALNKRTDLGDIEGLTESIRKNGIETPLLGRPTSDPNIVEVACGKRRRHGSEIAGITHVPIVIRPMTDLEVLDAQTWENGDRKEFTPLEEADLYDTYAREHKLTIDQIAERTSRSRRHVLVRLKLLSLVQPARDALSLGSDEKGALDLGAAEQLACYPASVQEAALPHMLRTEATAPMGGAAAKAWLARNYTLKLATPPFDPEDAGLVPAAGKCSACPKRSGNQAELFADLADDTCTDVACYDAKGRETWNRKADKYRANGYMVLDDEATREVFGGKGMGGWLANSPVSPKYVSLDDKAWTPDGEKTYRQILGGKTALKNATVMIARHPESGKVYEVLDAKEAATLAEERKTAGKIAEIPQTLEKHTASGKEARKLEKERERAQWHTNDFLMSSIVSAVAGAKKLDAGMWRLIARLAVDNAGLDVQRHVSERRELVDESDACAVQEALHAHIEQLPIGGCVGLIFELGATRGMTSTPPIEPKRDGVLGQAAKMLELEWSALVRDGKKYAASFGTSDDSGKKRAKKSKKTGACRVCGCTDEKPCGEETNVCTWIVAPETAKGRGLCSACGEPAADIVEMLRNAGAPQRLSVLLAGLRGRTTTAPIIDDEGRREKVLAYLESEGTISRTRVGREEYLQLEREPDESDNEDESDESDDGGEEE